jgi:NAD(P)-dependent dehydrogenase (short-subunit alcohol dehydrogenase family)
MATVQQPRAAANTATADGLLHRRAQGHDALYQHLDVTEADQWTRVVRSAEESYGAIGVLVNNAGISAQSPVCDTSDSEWNRVVEINQRGVFLGMRHTIPSMLGPAAGRSSRSRRSSVSVGRPATSPTTRANPP